MCAKANGDLPGLFIQACIGGDVLQVKFTNHDQSVMAHSVDFIALLVLVAVYPRGHCRTR
jgi:hypothetical protein